MKNNKGFTLIELMITVAIVGVLASIALPAYQDYTIRSQVSEGLVLTQEVKSNVIEYHANKGLLPNNNNDANYSGAKGKYIGSVEVEAGGKIVATFSKDSPQKANIKIDGKHLILTPTPDETTGNLIWKCEADIESKYLPQPCQ